MGIERDEHGIVKIQGKEENADDENEGTGYDGFRSGGEVAV